MTYCVGLLLDQGLVLASDSRTNAGVDYISSYSKLHLFQPAPDRIFILLAAGSLATTREVLDRIRRDLDQAAHPSSSHLAPGVNLLNANYLFEAANYIGQVSLAVQNEHGPALRQVGVSAEATFILGGQIAGQPQGSCSSIPRATPSPPLRRPPTCRSARASSASRCWTASPTRGYPWTTGHACAWSPWRVRPAPTSPSRRPSRSPSARGTSSPCPTASGWTATRRSFRP